MLKLSVQHRSIGLNFTGDRIASLLIWAPEASKVEIEIIGKGVYTLRQEEHGYWKSIIHPIDPGDRYKLIIDGLKLPDPASLSQPDGVHVSSEAVDLTKIQWNDNHWKNKAFTDLIIYELHTGTFTPKGNFEGIIEKLDYLKSLGITAIEIMPVSQFPGSRNWGYDGVYPFAVQSTYGGIQGFTKLIDECHKNDLSVILDVVYNHLGPEGNYLPSYGPCFNDNYLNPWGKAMNFDDEWCDGIRDFFIENALMWFRDFHIDGLRLDAIHAIKDLSARHIIRELKEYTDILNEHSGKQHFLIGECDLNDTKYITSTEKGGYGLDAQWADEFHHALHSVVTGETEGYYADFGSLDHLCKTFREAYVYDGVFSPFRKKVFGSKTSGFPGHQFVVFSQNHDQVGNRMLGERLSVLTDFEILKVTAAAVFLSPFIPLIFMGEEYGETSPFLYFTDHSDQQLIYSLIKGRLNEFKKFKNIAEPINPQLEETFNRSKLQWSFHHNDKQNCLLQFYREIIFLRKIHPASRADQEIETIQNAILIKNKNSSSDLILSILNFGTSAVSIRLKEHMKDTPEIILYSAEKKWGGPIEPLSSIDLNSPLNVNARSVMILSCKK